MHPEVVEAGLESDSCSMSSTVTSYPDVCRENTHRSTFDPEPSGYSLTLLTPVALPANKIRDVKIIERFNMIIQYSTIQ